LGSLVVEFLTIRRHMNAKLPELLDKLKAGLEPIDVLIKNSGLLKRQKKALIELTLHCELDEVMREALARRLIYEEQAHYDRIVKITDFIARLAPMFGLMGTLIPLGPGIIALGQGDTYTLSKSLLIAFDTTVAGLISAAIAFAISGVRKMMYENYMTAIEVLMECLVEVENGRNR
ncbi:MAG: MotA/TolQ/ExbB proton channel family protein, partial [Clostridiales bacterium]